MEYSNYVRSLGVPGIIVFPREIGHWLVARSWTKEVRIVPVSREDRSYRFQFAAAQVKAPIHGNVPLYKVRLGRASRSKSLQCVGDIAALVAVAGYTVFGWRSGNTNSLTLSSLEQ